VVAKKRAVKTTQPKAKGMAPRRPRPRKAPTTPPVVSMAEVIPWSPPPSESISVSYVCPMCCTRRLVSPQDATRLTRLKHVPLSELACSAPCREQWWAWLLVTIRATQQEYVLRDADWVWELRQGVVAERLGEVFQGVRTPV
jgi:hypothetical protein